MINESHCHTSMNSWLSKQDADAGQSLKAVEIWTHHAAAVKDWVAISISFLQRSFHFHGVCFSAIAIHVLDFHIRITHCDCSLPCRMQQVMLGHNLVRRKFFCS